MGKAPYRRNQQTNLEDFNIDDTPRDSPRDWSCYNRIQTNEKTLFLQLLGELLDIYIKEPQNRYGRKPKSLRDMLFCVCYMKYTGFSSRRISSDLKLLQRQGYIKEIPHFNTLLNYMKRSDLTPLLKRMILIAGLPLAQFEEVVAVDASGFSTESYKRWMDVRKNWRQCREYRKVHISSGVKTNVVTAIEVSAGNEHDSNYFESLVKITSRNFSIKEVLADMAYSSRENFQIAQDNNMIPFIPFKRNARGNPQGFSVWRKMFDFYSQHYDLFMHKYHLRSNVESTFSMVKRKFGSHVRSKNEDSQDNEILCIFLCHNILLLIKGIFEFGIFPDFEKMCNEADCTLIH